MRRPTRLFVGALLLRLCVPALALWLAGTSRTFHTADTAEYLELARALLETGSHRGPGGPELHRTPGYPLFLTPGLAIGHPVFVALALQAVLGALTAVLVYRIVLDLGHEAGVAEGCGWLCAFDPVQVAWDARLMAEALLTVFVTLSVLALLREMRQPAGKWLLLAATSAAAAAYVKPVAAYLAFPLALCVAWLGSRVHALPGRATRALVLIGVCLGLMAPWMARNALVAGFLGFSSTLDRALALRPAALRLAEREHVSYVEARERLLRSMNRATMNPDFAEARRQGIALVLRDPVPFGASHGRGMLRALLNPGTLPMLELFGHAPEPTAKVVDAQGLLSALDFSRESDGVFFAWTLALLPIHAAYLGLFGLGLLRPTEAAGRSARLAMLVVVLYFLVLGGGPWGQSRFRHPFMPLVCALAAWALSGRRESRFAT